MHTLKKTNLLMDTIMTQAFADAFGYVVEFDNITSIRQKFGSKGYSILNSETSRLLISDDTQMTLFALESILQCIEEQEFKYRHRAITNGYLNWLATQQYTQQKYPTYLLSQEFLYSPRAPGRTCLDSLNNIDKSSAKLTFDTIKRANDSKGCGGIMRTLPFAFFSNTKDEAWKFGCDQAAITHGHTNGFTSAGFYTLLCFHLLNSTNDIKTAYKLTKEYASTQTHSLDPYLKKLDDCLENFDKNNIQLNELELNNKLDLGWTGDEALVISIYCAITSKSLAQAIEVATIHNGDSDSTAMLAAGIYKIANPDEHIPQIKNLIEYDNLQEVLSFFSSKIYSIYQQEPISKMKI